MRIYEAGNYVEVNPEQRIRQIEARLQELPKGTLTYKTINGKKQPYLQQTVQGKSVSYYVKKEGREELLCEIEERRALIEEKKHLFSYMDALKEILKSNPYLGKQVGIGLQEFTEIIDKGIFYVDKTQFISEWWADPTKVTLITRPRRFGKTLMLSTIEAFFDPVFAGHAERFEKLKVWKDPVCRELYGKIPVILISFGSVKVKTIEEMHAFLARVIYEVFAHHSYMLDGEILSVEEKAVYKKYMNQLLDGNVLATMITFLSEMLFKYHERLPIILLDEYDTPLIEAYTMGYWDEMINFWRGFFNEVLKRNKFFQHALVTGVTRISKNSLFSDMNHAKVVTCTSNKYGDCFGFTEQEVMDILKCQNVDDMLKVKEYYDGFIFGDNKDIYNPWSITCFLEGGKFKPYWIDTAGNEMIGQMIRKYPRRFKWDIEELVRGNTLHKRINENVAMQYMDGDEEAFWALLLATGYIKAENVRKDMEYTECDVSITNLETMSMFKTQILRMFPEGPGIYNEFVEALLSHDMEELNIVANDITYTSVSYFDTGRRPSEKAPENFYHGLVLGLIVSLKERYQILSNRESGRGRYDISMIPLKEEDDAFIIEFKVRDEKGEANLEETAVRALQQIADKGYEQDLLGKGIPAERIYKLGFAFEGKEVLVLA